MRMRMSKGAFKKFVIDAQQKDSYWVERAILDFTCDLEGLMKSKGISKSELARKIGSSPAYITKVLRGNANFTVESLVKLSRAVGGELHLHVAEEKKIPVWVPPAFQWVETNYSACNKKTVAVEVGDAHVAPLAA